MLFALPTNCIAGRESSSIITTALEDSVPEELSCLAWILAWACSVPAPSLSTLRLAAVKLKSFPVKCEPVADVVQKTNSSLLSSQSKAALLLLPRSIIIPASPDGVPEAPVANSRSCEVDLKPPSVNTFPKVSKYIFSASSANPKRRRSVL